MASTEYERSAISGIEKQPVPICPACRSKGRHKLADVREHEYTTTTDDDFPLMECDDCGAWYLDPRPHSSTLDIIYPPNYFAYALEARADSADSASRSGAYASLRNWLYRRRIRPIEAHIELTPRTRWLDIGCGDGAVLEAMRAAYGIVGTGIDLSERSVRICRRLGFEASATRFEDYRPSPGESYDLVHSSHVIEHLESPLDYMRKVYDLLVPGGLSVFITPNSRTWEARRLGRHWGGLHVPRHWTILDPASASRLGEEAGFEHLSSSFSTNAGFWNFSFHSLTAAAFGRRSADALFPSDHRATDSNLWNVARSALFTAMDVANLLLTRESSNMLVVHRKPIE